MSIKQFESTLLGLLDRGTGESIGKEDDSGSTRLPDPSEQINPGDGSRTDTVRALNAAFLITLAGPGHRLFWEADVLFEKIIRTEEGSRLGRYYQRGRSMIWRELESLEHTEPRIGEALTSLACAIEGQTEPTQDQQALLSEIPVTVAYLRGALAAAALFADGKDEEAANLLELQASTGSP